MQKSIIFKGLIRVREKIKDVRQTPISDFKAKNKIPVPWPFEIFYRWFYGVWLIDMNINQVCPSVTTGSMAAPFSYIETSAKPVILLKSRKVKI
ncbi:MAG: hypothetical protein JRF41_11755 [Deltaproteobacteria bacterium]|nr:hypothetical protein [Deltaproteobacteria bacterium]